MDFHAMTASPNANANGNGGPYDFPTTSSISTPNDHYDALHQPQQQGTPSAAAMAAPRAGLPVTFTPTGPMSIDPSLPPSDALNPRSCVVCRKRKVRCDKHMPCSNCRKANIQCVFPAPGRAPRRPRPKDPNAPPKQASEREVELMKRLRKLEGIVEDLSGQVEFETGKQPGSNDGSPVASTDGGQDPDRRVNIDSAHRRAPHSDPGDINKANRRSLDGASIHSPTVGVRKDFGRLVLNEKGKTKYVSHAFWTKVTDEINELKAETQALSGPETDDSGDEATPEMHSYADHGDHHGFLLGYKSSDADLSKLHPSQTQIPFIWQIYVDNVDPVVKILHVPTMTKTIRALRHNMDSITPAMEALLFSIYYAAVTSMEPEEVLSSLGVEKPVLINQYRFACEQALAKADFLTSSELVVAQAFAIFLVLVRRHDETHFAWTLTSVLIRIAHSMGLHREGTNFNGLKPFDVEMRRRLWWALCVIDLRAAEDHGTDLVIAEGSFDTRIPLNINDLDINPDSKEFPEERMGPTDTTFCLVRFEICSYARRIYIAQNSDEDEDGLGPVNEREETLEAMYQRVENKYFKESADKERFPLHWVAATIHRLIMAKIRLMMYQPMLTSTKESGEVLSNDLYDRIYLAAVEVVEYTRTLNSEPKCRQWRWLFQTYTQWHAVAFVIIEVIRRPWSASTERGWMALSSTFTDPEPPEATLKALHASVWIPMRKLMIKARRHREKELTRLRANPEAARQLDLEEYNKSLPASFRHLSASIRSSQAQEHWRKLVGREGMDPKAEKAGSGSQPMPLQPQQPASTSGSVSNPLTEQYLNQMMTDPQFNASNLFDVAFPGESSFDQVRQAAFYGGIFAPGAYDPNGSAAPRTGAQHQPQNSTNLAGNTMLSGTFDSPSSKTYSGALTPANADPNNPNHNMVSQPQQGLNTVIGDNSQSWLWDQWGSGPANSGGANNLATMDADVSMDEDFSWQDWQDTLRGYDTDGTLGIGRPGFLGGI